jgi:hypothetical protein
VDLIDVVRACLRRWYVVLVVVAVFALLALHLGQGVRPSWSASATLVVVPSPGLTAARDPAIGEDGPGDTNPFTSASTLSLLVSQSVATEGVLTDVPPGTTATASWDGLRPSLVLLSSTGAAREDAAMALDAAVDGAQQVLADLQTAQGVAPDAAFIAVPGAGADAPVQITPDRRRMVVVISGAGALAAVTVATALDTALRRRRHDRSAGVPTDRYPTPARSGSTVPGEHS